MKIDGWQELEPVFLAFEAAWSRESTPSLDEAVENVPADRRTEALAELVMIDFEHRCRRGLGSTLDSYFQAYPVLVEDKQIRDDLLRHELEVRSKLEGLPTLQELETRFPGDTKVIELRNDVGNTRAPDTHIRELVRTGTTVDGFRVEDCAGSGMFATVFRATDLNLKRSVALKFLSHSDELRPEWRLRMIREAQAVAALEHPNVAPVYGTGSFRGHDYIATRFVDGRTLGQTIRDEPLPLQTSVDVVRQLAGALDHAHQRGVIHRDVKPANIMMEGHVPLLVDFGLAHFVDANESLTRDGDLVGTPAFMSPEQASGRARDADGRSDIYSLGAVLYRLACDRLPFEGTTVEIVSKLQRQVPTAPRDIRPELSRDLQTIILKCLRKEPADRYQTAGEMHNDLAAYLTGDPIQARPLTGFARFRNWLRRRPVVAALGIGLTALTVFVLGVSTQLYRVAGERNEAQSSEQETQALLAESAASAGQLAMQRGRIEEAVQHFEQALARGHADEAGILLKLVEANFLRRDLEQAAIHWRTANERESTNDMRAALSLWRAELALEGRTELGDGELLMRSAAELELPPDEKHYVDGVLAETSPDAVTALRQATKENPFHHRARRLLAFTLLSLARLDESAMEIRIAREQFPEDPDFFLLDSLCRSASRDLDGALAVLDQTPLGVDELAPWRQFCRELHGTVVGFSLEKDIGAIDAAKLGVLATRFNTTILPLMRSRNWRVPPRIGHQFATLMPTLPEILLSRNPQRAAGLSALVESHPEASLLIILGGVYLSDSADTSLTPAEQIEKLEEARDAFRASVDLPGILKNGDQLAWKAIFATSVTLWFQHKHDIEQNEKILAESARNVDIEQITDSTHARAFSLTMIRINELEEGARWVDRWVEVANDDVPATQDALWHRGIICQRRKDWSGVKAACDGILELNVEHAPAKAMRGKAIGELAALASDAKERDQE